MEDELVPELGDWVTIMSDAYKTTSGRIIYRDGALIRIRPTQSSNTGVDFPLDPETGLFQEALGVQEILILEKRKTPHFSLQLSVVEGEILEIFSVEGTPIGEATVARIVATDTDDGIVLADGTELNFQFIGSASPNDILRPRAAPENVAPPENNSSSNAESVDEKEPEPEVFPELDYNTLPAALVEEIPSEERTFSDSVQREDMFVSLLVDIPLKRQRDPRVMQSLYRTTDLLLAMKNSVVVRDEAGAVIPNTSTSYVVDSLQDILDRNRSGDSLRAFLPVMAVKKVLYTDDKESFETEDTESRSDVGTLATVAASGTKFIEQSLDNAFVGYIHSVLQTIQAYIPASASRARIPYDMDVLRSQIPPKPVIGFLEVPATLDKKKEPQSLYSDSLSTINNRYVRLLSASYLRNPKTGAMTVVAPADSGDVLSQIILSSDMLRFRSPIRSSVLLWDIGASEASRDSRVLFYTSLMKNWAAQEFYDPENVLPLAEFLADRLPVATSFNDERLMLVLDSFGLRNLEISTTAFEPVLSAIHAGITKWKNQYAELMKVSLAARALVSVPAVAPLLGSDSALITTLNDETIKPIVAAATEDETLLKAYDFTIVNKLTTLANKTFGIYYYGLAGGVAPELLTKYGNTYKAEARRIDRNTTTLRDAVSAFQAAPIINPCKHVKELEKIMNIRRDEDRMLLFEKFLNQFQAGQRGNYIMCGNCGQDMICKHEVLLLNEFLHPGRQQALHKALLLEYAGPVFEAAYICKSCGQKIQALEYDTHLEFDDEGRPLVGRGVVSSEDDETAPQAVLREDAKEAIPFETDADIKLYFVARTLFERCGYVAPVEVYKRVVKGTQDYLKLRVMDRATYEKLTSGVAAKGKKPVTAASYDTFFANNQVGVLGAFAVLELQTSEVNVPFPAAGCEFSRAGFPLDGDDPAVAGDGALNYVKCAIASIYRNDAPWNLTTWSPETQIKKRFIAVEKAVRLTLLSILCISTEKTTPAPLTTITDTYKELLRVAKAKETTEVVKASETDRLPPAFRPMSAPVDRSLLTEGSVQNVKKFQADTVSMPVAQIGPFVRSRTNQLNAQLVGQFYKESVASAVIIENSPRSDSVCCFGRLADVGRVGVGVASLGLENLSAELELQSAAATTVARRDSAAPNCGTHIYVPWSASTRMSDLAELDSSGYYKLFLQYCYRGPRHGGIHEFNVSGVCRWCKYAMPSELLDLTIGDISEMGGRRQRMIEELNARREQIAMDGLRRQNIAFDEVGFRRLENAMKNFKAITPPEPIITDDLVVVLTGLGGTLGMLLPPAAEGWGAFINAMKVIADNKLVDVERSEKLYQFSLAYDSSLNSLLTQMAGGLGVQGCDRLLKRIGGMFGMSGVYRGTDAKVGAAVELLGKLFDALTVSQDGSVVLRNYIDTFVKEGSQIRYFYAITNPNGSKWFPKISRNHNGLLVNIWTKSFASVLKASSVLRDYSQDTIDIIQASLDRFTAWFGAWLAVISADIRSGVQLTPKEYRLMIQWSLFNGLLALFSETSPMYADATDSVKKVEATKFHINWVCDAMINTIELIGTYQKTTAQIAEAINARAELEKAYFIKKFDDLDKDLRDVEKRKKALKIGDWAVGTLKNLFSYDADFFEFERGQRAAMGLPEFSGDITGLVEGEPVRAVVAEEGYSHRAPADEDID
jgi:hypothetical protein